MSSAAAGLFPPLIRCSILKDRLYFCDFVPLCDGKIFAGLLLPIESVLLKKKRKGVKNMTNRTTRPPNLPAISGRSATMTGGEHR